MAQMVSAASLVLLLFLPLKSCLPLEWPGLLPSSGLRWEPWLRRSEWEDKPSLPPFHSEEGEEGGSFPAQSIPRSCKLPGGQYLAQEPNLKRSTASSKRRDGRPNSLDLTFHLLREFLEMSREERLAQRARSNKILLHNIGK